MNKEKYINENLQSEGITSEYLNRVQELGKLSPVLFEPDSSPVELVRANKQEYWVRLPDGNYQKDKNNKLVKIPLNICIIARAKYLKKYKDDEIKAETAKEVEKIGKDILKIANKLVSNLKEVVNWTENEPTDTLVKIVKSMNPKEYEWRKKEAEKYIGNHPNLLDDINSLQKLIDTKDYDMLYLCLEQGYAPAVLTIEYSDNDGMELLKKYFHVDKINETVETLNSQSHIESIAMFKVQKKYINL